MRQPPTPSLAHLLMVAAGLVSFVAVTVVLRDSSATVNVIVAASDLQAGSELTHSPTVTVEVAATDPLLGELVEAQADLTGRYLAHPVAEGQPILERDLVLAGSSDQGRTITIPADAYVVSGLGLAVGDRVDLIAGTSPSVFVVAGVEIVRLPAGEALAGFAAATTSSWITVRVSPTEALAARDALALGDIGVVRSTGAPAVAVGP